MKKRFNVQLAKQVCTRGAPIVTTSKLGKFFQEIGRRVAGMPAPPPTEREWQRFVEIAASYGYWLGGKTENASIGISLFR